MNSVKAQSPNIVHALDAQLVNLKFCHGRNSLQALEQWVDDTLRHLEVHTIQFLTKVAQEVIDRGGLRGNISDMWKSHGWNSELIPDMYN